MPDQSSSNTPSRQPNDDSLSETVMPPFTPEQREMSNTTKQAPSNQLNATVKLERDIKKGEIALIVINALLLITTIVIARIYSGQLDEMRKATDAATKNADAADATLKEIRQGGTDTHELAVQAKNQANRTKDVADRALEQAKATNELAREAKRSADAAVTNSKAAQETAITGQRNLVLAERVLFVQERPWIGLENFTAVIESGKPITITVAFHNFGRSPAFDVEILNSCSYDIQPELVFEGRYALVQRTGSISIMMPNASRATDGLTCGLNLTPQQSSLVETGMKRIFMFGQIRYRDSINTANPSHTTKFCGVWNQKTRQVNDCSGSQSAD